VNGETTGYLYEGDKVVLETNQDNSQKAFQVYGTNLLYRSVGVEEYYYLYNAHGDVTSLMEADGNIAATYDYDAFGNIITKTGNADNNILYAGYQQDDESGLYYLNARYYDSTISRFITEDTYLGQKNDPLSLNLYSYCANNPIMYIDPSGHVAGSIVDYLNTQHKDSTYSARKELAKDLGIKNYKGTADQNSQMLKLLQKQEEAKVKAEKREAAKKAAEIKTSKNETSKEEKVNQTKSIIEVLDKNNITIIDGSDYKAGKSADTREELFVIQHPIAAIQIGSVEKGSNNISTIAARFSNNYLGFTDDPEGSQENAFRHTLWQSKITNQFDTSIALAAGNAHEEHPDALDGITNFNKVLYTNLSLADETCDLLNNQIGRQIGQEYDSFYAVGDLVELTSMKTLALATLDYYHENGLWIVVEQSDGLYAITQEKLSDGQYKTVYDRMITFDDYGRSPNNKK
jgi:RHS repeat-associated protein